MPILKWTDHKELRKFGMIMAGGFAAVSVLLWVREVQAWSITAAVAVFFLVTGLLLPSILRPLEWLWMKFAHVLGIVMTHVLLTVVFFTGITLTGLIMRLFGKRPLDLRFPTPENSCWRKVDPQGPCSRPEKPY